MDNFLEGAICSLEKMGKYKCYQHLKRPIEMMKLEFKFLKMFVWGSLYWDELEHDWHYYFSIHTIISTLEQKEEEFVEDCSSTLVEELDLGAVLLDLEKIIDEQLRPQAKEVCIRALGGSSGAYKCMSPIKKDYLEDGEELSSISSFINLILQNLRELQKSNPMAPVMKQQITLLERKLEEFGTSVGPISPSINQVKKMYELISCARTWFSRISYLAYLYWSDGKDESMTPIMGSMLSGLLHKTMPFSISGVVSTYSQPTMIPQLLAHHLDFILEDLALHTKHDIEILQEGLIFMLAFIVDPPLDDTEDRETIFTHIYAVINELPSLTSILSDLLLEINTVKAKVTKLYLVIPYSVQFRPPSTNATQFLNSLIDILKKRFEMEVNLIPSLMHQCELVLKELTSLRPLLESMGELQGGEQDEIITVVYNGDYVIRLCLVRNFSIWYGIIALPHIVEQIKIEVDKLYNKKQLSHDDKMVGKVAIQPHSTTSEIENDCMGFIEDERVMMDKLRRGKKSLTIISISGSGGQGKTTFAKRIYNESAVQCHFQKRVWCYVSSDCSAKNILENILFSDTKGDVSNNLDVQDLVERVRKSLKERRYLIVMDDIWDIDSWEKLESSFPDDRNGSRILLTSRNHDLASQVKLHSISHPLPLLSDEESWELLKRRVFGLDICEEELVGIGRQIAGYCKGLPLAVVLIAAVLRRTKQILDSWIEVAENLKAHLANEGCGKVIELSYKCLPDHLKSCFLYFGAFGRGENVNASELKLLWMGEGFIIQDKKENKDLAMNYLNDLVSQGLVVVTAWGSMGEIKKCNVHDLLYDLCLEKCKEENFLNWIDDSFDQCSTISPKFNHHRLLVGAKDPFVKPNPIVTDKELLVSPLHSFLSSKSFYADSKSFLPVLGCFKIITVLKLKLGSADYEFPKMILSSLHLRYLALKLAWRTMKVPPEISKLLELETLIIDWHSFTSNRCVSLPVTMWSMKSLRHVHIKDAISESEDFNLKNPSIETVGKLRLHGNDRTTVDFLRSLLNLGKLSCGISRERRNNILEWLSMVGSLLSQLQSLKVDYTEIQPSMNRYPYEGNPNPDISNLLEIGHLKKLTLDSILIPWSVLSKIGQLLPNLQVLKLRYRSCVGNCWKLEDGDFSKLVYLNLEYLEIEEIDVSSCEDDPPFPCLEHLVLDSCTKLQEIPLAFGEICGLKKILLVGCKTRVTTSAMQILDEQKDFENQSLQVVVENENADEVVLERGRKWRLMM